MATLDRLAPPPTSVLPRGGATWSPRRAIAAAVILAAAIAALQVFQLSGFANTGETMQRLERERVDTAARVSSLEAEVAALSSLDRTERAARERLGMVPAKQIIHLQVGVPAPEGPLLPAFQSKAVPAADQAEQQSFWRRLLEAIPLF